METVCNLQLFKNPLFYQLKWYLVSFKMGDCIDFFFFHNQGIRTNLHALRLISRPTEHPASPAGR